jgi:endonuclease/exonuclease/phosphatase family metal-dependent hydrolase
MPDPLPSPWLGLHSEIHPGKSWGTAILTHGLPLRTIPVASSHPGALLAAEISLPGGGTLTAITMYGLIDKHGYATTTVHRMLSDLTPLLNDGAGKRDILLGGDWNVSIQWDQRYPGKYPAHRLLFDRVEDFGLENCTRKVHGKHVATYKKQGSPVEWQNDYLFVSRRLSPALLTCVIPDNQELRDLSDHSPVVITLDI